MECLMSAFLRSHSRVATIALAIGLGAAALATPAAAIGRGGPNWTHGSGFQHGFQHNGNFGGRGGWGGPGIGAAVVGGLIGGAIIGSAAYPYYGDPCWQYQDAYGPNGQYLGRQMVDTCLQ
jgi:hypothetical protein